MQPDPPGGWDASGSCWVPTRTHLAHIWCQAQGLEDGPWCSILLAAWILLRVRVCPSLVPCGGVAVLPLPPGLVSQYPQCHPQPLNPRPGCGCGGTECWSCSQTGNVFCQSLRCLQPPLIKDNYCFQPLFTAQLGCLQTHSCREALCPSPSPASLETNRGFFMISLRLASS